ncbi:MAG: hypothetical protein JWN98_2167 [Abditibacteriota bacterium]|nr:hypothetical protein [Abditibacteriota bacterium]
MRPIGSATALHQVPLLLIVMPTPPSELSPTENSVKRDAQNAVVLPARPTVPLSALLSGQRWRMTARWIGLGIFMIGAVLLAYVFWQALVGFQNFTRPDYVSRQFTSVGGVDWASRIQAMVGVIASEVLRVLYLLLLGFFASAIATKGIQFFSASEAVIDEAVAVGIEE